MIFYGFRKIIKYCVPINNEFTKSNYWEYIKKLCISKCLKVSTVRSHLTLDAIID